MIKIFKDLLYSYFIIYISGVLLLYFLFCVNILGPFINFVLLLILWILLCMFTFQKIPVNRYKKIVDGANNECRIIEALPKLYYYYNLNKSSNSKIYFAMAVASYLNQIGRSKEALELLSQYDPEKIFKRKRDQLLKYNYYMTLSYLCVIRFAILSHPSTSG